MRTLPPMTVPTEHNKYKIVPFSYFDAEPRDLVICPMHYILRDDTIIVSRATADGIITHANQAFVITSGYTRQELIGNGQNIIRHPDMPRTVFEKMWETISSGQRWEGHVKNLRKDGGYYWVHATIQPIMQDGKPKSYTSVRRKMDRKTIEMAERLYAEMCQDEERRQSVAPAAPTEQP